MTPTNGREETITLNYMRKITEFEYEGTPIAFHFDGDTNLINLSYMAKKFGKQVNLFFRSKQTANYATYLHKCLTISRIDNFHIENIRSFTTENLAKIYLELIR